MRHVMAMLCVLAAATIVTAGCSTNPLAPSEEGSPTNPPPGGCVQGVEWTDIATRCVQISAGNPYGTIATQVEVPSSSNEFLGKVSLTYSDPSDQDLKIYFEGIDGTTGKYLMRDSTNREIIRQPTGYAGLRTVTVRAQNVPRGTYKLVTQYLGTINLRSGAQTLSSKPQPVVDWNAGVCPNELRMGIPYCR